MSIDKKDDIGHFGKRPFSLTLGLLSYIIEAILNQDIELHVKQVFIHETVKIQCICYHFNYVWYPTVCRQSSRG